MNIILEGDHTSFPCEGDTILRAALRAGLGFPYACNTGSCGNCRFTLVEGSITHASPPPAWSERDLKKNRWMGCQAVPQSDCTIKLRLDRSYEPMHKPRRMASKFVHATQITHDIFEFSFALDAPMQALPGQYALIYLPGMDMPRAYSMCEISQGGDIWSFQIKLVPGGAGSAALGALEPAANVGIDGPYGTAFLRPEAPRDILCIAGGSGLSPMISITRAAAHSPELTGRTIHFVYGGRMIRDLCGQPMLETLPGYGHRLHYWPVLSNHPIDDPDGWTGARGYVHEAISEKFGDELGNFEIYFAGPPPMAGAIKKLLFERGVPQEQVHYDEFY
ncbi:2Fe-2S iron-sulfur cluster-binding protein [Pelagibacterium luteolum]|uniref:Toluene monooxygenase electron transfer component n=1 Tax=Pelagibacterium luteolum TaxID=440168 RepID=A0A1G7SWI0_9HYPH|nr:toluene monooxygenase electron transfer component [Pelagibacterium luteolum]